MGVRPSTLGTFGAIGFPLYGWIWSDLFPQPYENSLLRIALSIACFAIVLLPVWPKKLKPYWPLYWWVLIIFTLPFFFTFMLFMNGFSIAWSLSLLTEITILALLMDGRNFLIHHIAGSFLAYLAYIFTTGTPELWSYNNAPHPGEMAIVLAFSLGGAVAFNLTDLVSKEVRSESTINVGKRLAHELRTPLQAMINYAARVSEREDTQDNKRNLSDLNMIDNEAKHCLVTIELLLANANATPPQRGGDPVSITKIIKESISATARHKGHIKWFHITQKKDFYLRTTPNVLRHLLDNMLTNAIYAVQKADLCEEGSIQIVINGTNNSVAINDNGCGISPENQTHIFQPFFTTKPTGTGIGLSYCYEIIDALGGHIEMHSKEGKGTSFIIYFPKTTYDELHLTHVTTS